MNILHIDASASEPATSHSRRLTAEIVCQLERKDPDATVIRRDVVADLLPHVDTSIRVAWDDTEKTGELADLAARSRTLVAELKAADVYVIGAPMYNFTVPSTLKAWIDHVAIAGQTFRYTETGPRGLLEGKRAYLALSSGGIYSEGPGSKHEHLDTYLRSVLGLLGVSDVQTVRAEGTALGPERSAVAMRHAQERIEALISE